MNATSPRSILIFESVATKGTSRKILDFVARYFGQLFITNKVEEALPPTIGQVLKAKKKRSREPKLDAKGRLRSLPDELCFEDWDTFSTLNNAVNIQIHDANVPRTRDREHFFLLPSRLYNDKFKKKITRIVAKIKLTDNLDIRKVS